MNEKFISDSNITNNPNDYQNQNSVYVSISYIKFNNDQPNQINRENHINELIENKKNQISKTKSEIKFIFKILTLTVVVSSLVLLFAVNMEETRNIMAIVLLILWSLYAIIVIILYVYGRKEIKKLEKEIEQINVKKLNNNIF